MDCGLSGSTALVTGASGGIGGAVAEALAAEGCRVALHYHRGETAVRQLARVLRDRHGLDPVLVQADLRDEASTDSAFADAVQALGRLDHLVVNAGVWVMQDVPLHEMSVDQWRDTLDADLTSAFLCSRAFLRHLREDPREEASLTFVASTAALFGEAGHADYSAAKAGMAHGLTPSLKNEIVTLAPRGRVNCVCPGWVRTAMTEALATDPAHLRRATATMALRKIATPEDVARAVLYLSSPTLSGHVSGTVLAVAGGMEGRLLWGEG